MAALLFFFLVSCATPSLDQSPATSLRIGVIGDQTGAIDIDAAYEILDVAIQKMNEQDVDIVLHTGDLLESSKPEEEVRRQWSKARSSLDRLDAPWMIVPGDHDVNPPGRTQNASSRIRENLFLYLVSQTHPEERDTLYFSTMRNGVRIIGLNSHERLHVDPRWGNVFLAAISQDQLKWLEAELAKTPRPHSTIVFLHQPLWYNHSGWEPVHRVLAQYGVDLVIAGHFHYDQIEEKRDGVQYLVVGATGGRTKNGSPELGAAHHISVVEIDEGGFRFDLITLEDQAQKFTPRRLMDRVQAIEVMLGGLRYNPERQVRAARKENKCMLSLSTIGAPTDLPMEFSIAPVNAEGQFWIEDAFFRREACAAKMNGDRCTMRPSYGVTSSNNSSVQLRAYEDPFWTGVLQFAERTPIKKTIDLIAEVAFEFESERYLLSAPLSVDVSPCLQ